MRQIMGKLISIIIPVYNCADYIDECLESVVKQTYKNWELIIVDDGSTDNTYQKLVAWQVKDQRINIIRQNNMGAGLARNRGIGEAKGEYISFLDGDDFWYNEYALESVINAAVENNCNVTGTFVNVYIDGKMEKRELHRDFFSSGEKEGKWISFKEEQNCYNYGSYLYKREFLIENKFYFPDYLRYQDPPFLVNVLVKEQRYYVIPIEWYCYRKGHKDAMFLTNRRKLRDYIMGISDVLEIAEKYGLLKLKNISACSLNDFAVPIIKYIIQGDMELVYLVARLYKYEVKEKIQFIPLNYMRHSVKSDYKRAFSEFWEVANSTSMIVIYGAGYYGNMCLESINDLPIKAEIVFAETNPPTYRHIHGKKCFQLEELVPYKEDIYVIVAVSSRLRLEMESNLERLGFKYYTLYEYLLVEIASVEGMN